MSLLLALFLVIHAAIHIGYIFGPAWPFIASDPWLVTAVWIAPDAVRTAGTALVLVTFAAFLLAALTATGFGRSRWRPLVIVASVAADSVSVAIPPHTGAATLSFDLHNRFTVPAGQVGAPGSGEL
mgnify:CR=1 FL=1